MLIDRYVDAWERCDVDAFTALLVDDATFAMPPLSTWYARESRSAPGHESSRSPGSGAGRRVLTRANAQPALAFYRGTRAPRLSPFALNVLTLRDDRVSDVTAFIARATTCTRAGCLRPLP